MRALGIACVLVLAAWSAPLTAQDASGAGSGAPGAAGDAPETVRNDQKIFEWGSPEHEALRWLAIEAGQAMPSGTGPFSAAELLVELRRIDGAELSQRGQEQRRWLLDRLSSDGNVARADVVDDRFLFSAGFELNLEGYLDTNRDLENWEYTPRERLPFISIPLEAWAGRNGYAILDLDFRKFDPNVGGNPTLEEDPYTNAIFTQINALDIEFPSRAFLSLGGDHWNVQLGRDNVNWGNGETGNLYLGDSVREYDFARLTTFWRVFKFSTIWISLDGRLSPAEREALADGRTVESLDLDGDGTDDIDVLGNTSKYADVTDFTRSFLAHRFEVRLWDRINLIATEGIIFGGKPMELRLMNPMFLYHNLYTNEGPGNVHMSYEIEATLRPGLVAYVQLSPDQWSSPLEQGNYTANEPNAVGYLAGVRWQQPTQRGFVRTIAEAAFLDPWMYIHYRGHSSITYRDQLATESFTTNGARSWIEAPLGYYTGNDSAVMFLESRYVEPNRWMGGLRGRVEVRGERDIDDTLPAGSDTDLTRAENGAVTPSGPNPEWTTYLTAFGEIQPGITRGWWSGRRAPFLTLGSEVTWATQTNRGNVARDTIHDLQVVLYTRFIYN